MNKKHDFSTSIRTGCTMTRKLPRCTHKDLSTTAFAEIKLFILKFSNRAHVIDDEAGTILRNALERGDQFVTISMDFSGVGAAIYPVTINTSHVHELIEKKDKSAVVDLRLARRDRYEAASSL